MDESEVEIRYAYTRESYISARKDFEKAFPEPLWTRIRGWILQTIFIVFGVLPILYYLWLYLLGFPIFRFTDRWIILTYGLILAIAIWDLVKWLRHRFTPPASSFDKDERWLDERHWIINDIGLQYEGPTQQSKYKWANFNNVIETPSAYLFTYGVKDYPEWFYLPKYAFESMEEQELFRTIAKRNIELKEMK